MFTLQSILACVLGREVNILQGEGDYLTEACAAVVTQGQENQGLSLDHVDFVLSELLPVSFALKGRDNSICFFLTFR